MKKIFFTAMATIAFSSVSFGKTIEVEEAENTKKQLIVNDNCCTLHSLAFDLARSEGATSEQASAYADLVYNNCMSGAGTKTKSISAN